LSTLQASLASIRDTDLPSAITQMTMDQTALQAAISAHASLSNKTLFDYFG
jgi:flagellin-like hook-associated protein FlgL